LSGRNKSHCQNPVIIEAIPDHLTISWFKNMERLNNMGEKHQIGKGKQSGLPFKIPKRSRMVADSHP
jgi:hypothetical protein